MRHIRDMKQPLIFLIVFISFFYSISILKDYFNPKVGTTYYFSDYISEDSYEKFVQGLPKDTTTISLSSGGGDIETALRLGNYISKLRLDTEVDYNESCSSACMYLLVSGRNIKIKGTVGLHEPSINGIKYRFTSGQQRLDLVEAKVILRSYVKAKGFSGNLIDYSYTIKSEEMRYLGSVEFLNYKLK